MPPVDNSKNHNTEENSGSRDRRNNSGEDTYSKSITVCLVKSSEKARAATCRYL